MQKNTEQRYAIKFCVKLNKSATETFDSLTEAYGDATLSRTMVFKWHEAFKEGRENVEDDPRSGRPISSTNDENVEVVRAVMVKDRQLRNLYLQDWQLITPFTKMSWNDFENGSSEINIGYPCLKSAMQTLDTYKTNQLKQQSRAQLTYLVNPVSQSLSW